MSDTPVPDLDPETELARLGDEFVLRLRRGEAASVEAEAAAHPGLAARIRRLFPVLQAMESLRPAPAEPPSIPARVGPYRVLRLLGAGGMGRVFEARAEEGAAVAEGTRVALKMVHPHLAADASALGRFLREAQVGRRVVHENVVRTLDSGVVDGPVGDAPYLVLEFVEGQTLRALLDEVGPVSERLARIVALECARGLQAMHGLGIVHRDVKPENLIVTPGERVRLMDLGVAALVDRALRVSRTGEFVGTLMYAAPEQMAGGEPEPRGDLYALGLVLFELLSGHHPLRDPAGGRAAVEPGVARLPANVSPFLAGVVQALLARDPNRRVGSARELAEVLEQGEASAWWKARATDLERPWELPRRGDLPLFGREPELAAIDEAWAAVRLGGARALVLEGEPGVGKSRLAREWVRSRQAAEPGVAVLAVEHAPGADPTPPLAAALRNHLGAAVEGRLRALGLEAARSASLAAVLLGSDPAALSPEVYAGTVATVLAAMASAAGLVLLVEDLHDAGANDLAVLQRVFRALRATPMLVLATTRALPEGHPAGEVAAMTGASTLKVDGLPAEVATALARAALGTGSGGVAPAGLAGVSGGNPFLLLELARAARATGGAPTPITPVGSLPALLNGRLARLGSEARQLLEAGACAGPRFDPLLVAEAAGVPRIAALKQFMRLEREHGLLRAEGAEYAFRHPLVREALTASLPRALVEAYALALADALEARDLAAAGGDRRRIPDGAAQTLAKLFLAGGRPERAAPYFLRALTAFWLAGRQDERDALVTRAGGTEGLPRLLAGTDLAEALLLASRTHADDPARATAALEQAHAIATSAGDELLSLRIALGLSDVWYLHGEYSKGRAVLQDAARRAAAAGAVELEAELRAALCDTLRALGLLEEALQEGRRAVEICRGRPPTQADLEARSSLALSALAVGDRAEARSVLDEGIAKALAMGHRRGEGVMLTIRSHLDTDAARFADALAETDRAADIAYELGQHGERTTALYAGTRALVLMGRYEEAAARLELIRAPAGPGQSAMGQVKHAQLEGVIDLDRGRFAAALAHAQSGLALARALPHPGGIHSGLLLLARLACVLGDAEGARRTLEELGPLERCPARSQLGTRLSVAWALLADLESDPEGRARSWDRALALAVAADEHIDRGWILLARGRARAALGATEEARRDHEQALAWARAAGVPGLVALALTHLAALGAEERAAARAALESAVDRSPLLARLEARLLLGRALADPTLLAAARTDLDAWLAGAPPGARPRILERVPLARAAAASCPAP